jgi:small GTP-binding protein
MIRDETYDHMVKILLIGDSGVGKTCILQRFNKNEFLPNHLTTIAIDFKMKIFEVKGVKLKMQIWDTAGQERFNTLTSGFFKGELTSGERCYCDLQCHR